MLSVVLFILCILLFLHYKLHVSFAQMKATLAAEIARIRAALGDKPDA